ncbi:MAG TPA: lipocalin family protein [Steroidobacteraceae bacterium]|nr:lipocalin family protein [Steroidobacteraceae bacterium]
MHLFRAALAAPLLSILLLACASTRSPVRTVDQVDLPRYMGDWYVIAEIPNFAEKHCVDSVESYALRADGGIDNWFSCRKKSFDAPMKRITSARAMIADQRTNATWHLRFLKVISVNYFILDLDPNYRWVMIGHPSRSYGWVLARTKDLPDALYQSILERAHSQGYDPTKFIRVPQYPTDAAGAR